MKRWYKEFYQDDPSTNEHWSFYRSRRTAKVILEEVSEVKKNLFLVKVVDIVSDENFRIMGVAGGVDHQYKIGEVFKLRQHTDKPGRTWINTSWKEYWFDVDRPGRDYCEGFKLINYE